MPHSSVTEYCFIPPARNCPMCERLCGFRQKNTVAYPQFFNGVVPAFGSLDARVLVVGLAPGLKGANATGRPFTGDYAGDILYESLAKAGFASGYYQKHADDGLTLHNIRITNAVRCVPPENKPTPQEISICNPFLAAEIAAMPNLKAVLNLGNISHYAVLKALGCKASRYKFAHGAEHEVSFAGQKIVLLNSYHTSRYNMQTRRLTVPMFDAIIKRLIALSENED